MDGRRVVQSNGILACALKEPRRRASRWSHRPVLAALPIFWAASSSPRPDEFRADAGLLTRHVWTPSHSVSIRPALFEDFLRWLVY